MREKILTFIEKNSRIDLNELAIILGVDEATVMNELESCYIPCMNFAEIEKIQGKLIAEINEM